jgi:hypothetical protein
MSHAKRHDYLVLELPSMSDMRAGSERIIPRESLDAARSLLECVDRRATYRLENCCCKYSHDLASRLISPKLPSLKHHQCEPVPFGHASQAPPSPPDDRHTIIFATGCTVESTRFPGLHPLPFDEISAGDGHETPGVFIVRETLLGSSTCVKMKAPIKFDRFISDVAGIMQHAQPGACNDFAASRLSLLELEFSRYR